MSTKVGGKNKMEADKNNKNKSDILPYEYGCEILLEKTSLEKVKNSNFPNDTYLIWYAENDKIHLDMVRGTSVRVFDMYYDRYGKDSIQKIDFGYGKINPKIWASNKEKKQTTKRRRG
jgi:hypothetical protein